MTELCLICLKNEQCLIKVVGKDVSNEEILDKLKNCVPEVKWNLYFKICNSCNEDLNRAYDFRKLCITSYSSWNRSEPDIKVEQNELKYDSDDNVSFGDHATCSHEEEADCDNYFECFQCKRAFKNKSVLESHIKQEHETKQKVKGKKSFPCKFCAKLYTTQNINRRHQKICKKRTDDLDTKIDNASKDSCSEDINEEKIEETNIAPTCSLCSTTFCNKYLLKRHLQNVHATEKKYKCDMCDSTFASPVYLNAHKRYHAGDRSHICSFCGKGFITASDLYHHEKIHANKRAYRCEICPKAFNTSSDLHKHKICVHADRSKWKYVCSYCERRFPLKTNLDTHVKTHTGEKNYPCHLCERRCINRSVLMRHIETHSNVVAFKCDLCMQGYKYRKSLDIHLSKIHGIGNVKVPERIKKFFCHLCSKSYFANNKLQKHLKSHSGERPFKCSNCEKSFVDKSYLKQHLKMAHNISEIKLEF